MLSVYTPKGSVSQSEGSAHAHPGTPKRNINYHLSKVNTSPPLRVNAAFSVFSSTLVEIERTEPSHMPARKTLRLRTGVIFGSGFFRIEGEAAWLRPRSQLVRFNHCNRVGSAVGDVDERDLLYPFQIRYPDR